MNKTHALVLAAGKSKRMKSKKSKVLHEILGKTIIEYVIDALKIEEIERIGVIIGNHNEKDVKQVLGDSVEYILQKKQLGTGHAVKVAGNWLNAFNGGLIVVVGDAPLINQNVIKDLIKNYYADEYDAVLLSAIYDSPPAYGRIIRDQDNKIIKIIEENDASEKEIQIKEVSSSHYCFNTQKLLSVIDKICPENVQNEHYLPDVIELFIKNGYKVEAFPVDDTMTVFGINSPDDLARASKYLEIT